MQAAAKWSGPIQLRYETPFVVILIVEPLRRSQLLKDIICIFSINFFQYVID